MEQILIIAAGIVLGWLGIQAIKRFAPFFGGVIKFSIAMAMLGFFAWFVIYWLVRFYNYTAYENTADGVGAITMVLSLIVGWYLIGFTKFTLVPFFGKHRKLTDEEKLEDSFFNPYIKCGDDLNADSVNSFVVWFNYVLYLFVVMAPVVTFVTSFVR